MNRFIKAVAARDVSAVREMLERGPKWRTWSQKDGMNALHFAAGVPVVEPWNVPANELGQPDPVAVRDSLAIAKLLVNSGIDINSIHRIPEKNGYFPASPVWYAYTRGRNEKLYRWLLQSGGSPDNCLFAIVWNDDVRAAELFRRHGAKDVASGSQKLSEALCAAIAWKRFDIAAWLLKNGADPNLIDPWGRTPLQFARKKKYSEDVIDLLLRYGAK